MKTLYRTHLDLSPGRLWELLTDPSLSRQWMPEVESIQPRTDQPAGVGLVSDMKIREGAKLVDYVEEITRWEPEQVLGIRMSGGSLGKSPMDLEYHIHPETDGVVLEYVGTWQPTEWSLRLLQPLIAWLGRRNASKAMERLQAYALQTGG